MTEPRSIAALLDHAADLVATGDQEGRLTAVNRAVEELTGYARDELVGESFSKIVAPEHVPLVAEPLRADGVYEIEIVAKDGTRVPVEISSTAMYDGGNHVGQVAIGRDLRARRRVEEQLRQAQKMEAVGRLASGVAHDFNNILLVIRGYCELAEGKLEQEHPARRYADAVAAEVERAIALLRRLLAFAREQPIRPRPLDLDACLAEMLDSVRILVGSSIDVELVSGPDGVDVNGDPAVLQQIVLNLAANASDAMPEGGRLRLETRNLLLGRLEAGAVPMLAPGPYRLLRVADSGTGMDESTRERAFEPLFTTKEHGTGLGLSMVYSLVHQLGGHVTVQSEPGEGTAFSIYLPRAL